MSVRRITTTLGVILAFALWPAMPLSAQEAGGPAPPPMKGPASKTAEPQPQDSPKESKTQPPQPPEPKTSDSKTQEPKGQDAVPPKPKDQDLKPQESVGKPGRSLILTVKLTLMADPRLFPYEIEVDLNGREAVLSGTVASEEEKQTATEIAQHVDGIKSVVNKLKVVKELPQALSRKRDETITQYVKERFKKSKTLEAAGFDVKTEDGVVSLSGRTRFQVIVLEAAEAARQTPGVKAVRTDGVRVETAD